MSSDEKIYTEEDLQNFLKEKLFVIARCGKSQVLTESMLKGLKVELIMKERELQARAEVIRAIENEEWAFSTLNECKRFYNFLTKLSEAK